MLTPDERKAHKRAVAKRYRQSAKGKAAIRLARERYNESAKGEAIRTRYERSAKGKAARKRYRKRAYEKQKAAWAAFTTKVDAEQTPIAYVDSDGVIRPLPRK